MHIKSTCLPTCTHYPLHASLLDAAFHITQMLNVAVSKHRNIYCLPVCKFIFFSVENFSRYHCIQAGPQVSIHRKTHNGYFFFNGSDTLGIIGIKTPLPLFHYRFQNSLARDHTSFVSPGLAYVPSPLQSGTNPLYCSILPL